MKVYGKALVVLLMAIVGCFIAASLLDIVLAAIYPRFYSPALFIVTFGVAGIIAGASVWGYQLEHNEKGTPLPAWVPTVYMLLFALLFIFFLSPLEGGEYGPAFMSFGITLGLTGIFTWFVREKKIS